MRLSDDGGVLGVTTYMDAEVELKRYCRRETLRVPRNMALLDERLYDIRDRGRRRYTLAHECAHQILWRDEPDARRRSMRTHSMRTTRRRYGQDVLEERQADAMAAALLMPPVFVGRLMNRFARGRRLISYGGRFNMPDKLALALVKASLGVSQAALVIRLRQLGYLYDLPIDDYSDPMEVWADE
jgi:Zn-dependent peptidase ImmA (M78 family)